MKYRADAQEDAMPKPIQQRRNGDIIGPDGNVIAKRLPARVSDGYRIVWPDGYEHGCRYYADIPAYVQARLNEIEKSL